LCTQPCSALAKNAANAFVPEGIQHSR
jgi:hypothetical protein